MVDILNLKLFFRINSLGGLTETQRSLYLTTLLPYCKSIGEEGVLSPKMRLFPIA